MAPFDPKENINPELMDRVMLGCREVTTLESRAKESHSVLTRWFYKIVHWYKHPNERIAKVRDVFNKILIEYNFDGTNPRELIRLCTNCDYFNSRVIQKHNDSWLTFFHLSDYVPLIDQGKLEGFKTQLRQRRSVAARHYDELTADLTSRTCTSDLSQRVRDLSANPYIYSDNRNLLHKRHVAYVKTRELHRQVLAVQLEDVDGLIAEVEKEMSNPEQSENEPFLKDLLNRLKMIDKMGELLKQWQTHISKGEVTEDIRTLHQKTKVTAQEYQDMKSHPYIALVQSKAQAIFSTIERHASWRAYFANKTATISSPASIIFLPEPENFDRRAEFDAFLKELPESEEKTQLVQQAEAFEALLEETNRVRRINEQAFQLDVSLRAMEELADSDLEALYQKREQLPSIQQDLEKLTAQQTDFPTIDRESKRLAHLKDIVAEYEEFKTGWEQFQQKASTEIASCEAAVDGLGTYIPTYTELPNLIRTLRSNHPSFESYLNLRTSLSALRSFVQLCSIAKPLLDDDIQSMSGSNQAQLCSLLDQIDRFVTQVHCVAPKIVEKYQAMSAACRPTINSRLDEFRAYHAESETVFATLLRMCERSEDYRKQRSLYFFQNLQGKKSLYQRTLDLLSHPLTSSYTQEEIRAALGECFPKVVYQEVALVEKCSQIWKKDEIPEFEFEELGVLEKFAATPEMPTMLAKQFELLLLMYKHKFHPKSRYVQEEPKEDDLVQQWLLCKDLLKSPRKGRSLAYAREAFLKLCPKDLIEIAQHSFSEEIEGPYTTLGDSYRLMYAQQKQPEHLHNKSAWKDLFVETFLLVFETLSHQRLQAVYSSMPKYVAQLYQTTENLDLLVPQFYSKLSSRESCAEQLTKLDGLRQLLHILLNQTYAFSENHFENTRKLAAHLLANVNRSLCSLLLFGGTEGITGPFPSSGETSDASALQLLYVRILAQNDPKKVRTSSIDEYKSSIRELHSSAHSLLSYLVTIRERVAQLVQSLQQHMLKSGIPNYTESDSKIGISVAPKPRG